ncbi:MAG: hypothetical protein G8345_07440 [Magnetococcales bacterium]|nr:hypothetical protein [Magnetococcales bacterium]NGZ26707.1 hypothetical protein [Magnetococcales bacterium]
MPTDKKCSSCRQDRREDKVVLWVDPFMNDVQKGMEKYNKKIKAIAKKKPLKKVKVRKGNIEKTTQKVWYLDTKKFDCYNNDYSLRVRQEKKKGKLGEVEFNVKYRHPDPAVVNGVNLKYTTKHSNCKYEQDVVPPFEIKFSRSGTIEKLSRSDVPKNMKQLRKIFPKGLKELSDVPNKKKLKKACDFDAKEVAYKKALMIDFGRGLKDVEAGFNFWYRNKKLVVAEFSFTHDLSKGGIPRKTARRAYAFFKAMQCPGMWVSTDKAATKTQFAYRCANKKDSSNC